MLQRSFDRVEMVTVIYKIAETVRGHDPETEKDNCDTERHLEEQHTGGDTAWIRCCRLTAVWLVLLLLVSLLTAVTVLWIKFSILTKDRDQLQSSYNNLTKDRDQLQSSYNNLTKDRDQLQSSYNNLTKDRDQLQSSYNDLTKDRDQLHTSYNKLTKERDQLQTSYNKLTKDRDQDQIQTSYNNLTKDRDQLQSSYNNLTKDRDQLQTSYNNLTKDRDQVNRSVSVLVPVFMSNETKNCEESRKECKAKGADLMIINSKEEQELKAPTVSKEHHARLQSLDVPKAHESNSSSSKEKHSSFPSPSSFKDIIPDISPTVTTTTHSMPAEVSSPQSTEVDESLSMSFEQVLPTVSESTNEDETSYSNGHYGDPGIKVGMSLSLKMANYELSAWPKMVISGPPELCLA
ncbi:centrosomal protein of 135 kDa-like [Tachysurus vachellii]|uniref:centrosomal protein of 135 kDa-like n=1 Tax=Tachysurus vachellii TaxID=175792 RepID=UPI00296AF6A4|nr:centrosomal protein of 135 kDa-like [Tachysurus vachellii]